MARRKREEEEGCGLFGWMILAVLVARGDCARDMCRHASEIKDLWGETRRNAEKIARLEK